MDTRGERISRIVKLARGSMSQRAFGRSLGVSSTAVQHWENGVSIPDTPHLEGIAIRAGYTLEQVVTYLNSGEIPDTDITTLMIKQVKKLSLKQLAMIDRAVSERLVEIADKVAT